MKKFKTVYILISLFLVTVSAVPKDTLCCPQGQVLFSNKSRPLYCWEPISKNQTEIWLKCDHGMYLLEENSEINFTVSSAGELILFYNGLGRDVVYDNFCVTNQISTLDDVTLSNVTRATAVCLDPEEHSVAKELKPYFMLVSVIFLALTALIYAMLPELRDLQGKSIINFCFSLGVGLLLLSVMTLVPYTDMNWCAVKGFFAYFFVLAAFFWSNAISIQILMSVRRPSSLNYGWKEFMWFAVYAWGCATAFTVCTAIVNYHPGGHDRPGIGLNHCWFYNHRQQWIYFYSVMSILITANIIIFVYTSLLIWRNKFSSTHIRAVKYKFIMTFELCILMGVPWIFEMISTLTTQNIIWDLLDLFNILQGLLIFLLLVVFRRRTLKAMHSRGLLCCMSGLVEKHLATANDDEQDDVQHTIIMPMT